jgi:uncharacterized protein involved in tolerance to divalent cations/predicted enzyme related to lactoylglutathione lyase
VTGTGDEARTVVVEVACASADEAARIGSSAVATGRAASAQHHPVRSMYRWEEEVHHADEHVLRLTTASDCVAGLVEHIRAEHSYVLPYVTVTPSPSAQPAGAQWVQDSTSRRPASAHRVRACYLTLDVHDLPRQVAFWNGALGGHQADVSPGSGERYAVVGFPGSSMRLLLQVVPEVKTGKNRLHLDLETDDLDAECGRLLVLGARLEGEHRENGFRWLVMADPEGNEFCLLEPRYPHLLATAPRTLTLALPPPPIRSS